MCNIWSDNICSSILRHSSIFGLPPTSAKINRGYYMTAWGYEFYLRVLKVSLFNWADMSCSIRVRIVYESWSRFVVSSIKSSVQKTSSLTHRLLAPDRFCKKDENLFRFFPWKCFALAFSLKALLHFKVFKMVAQGSQRLESVHFNCKARKAL